MEFREIEVGTINWSIVNILSFIGLGLMLLLGWNTIDGWFEVLKTVIVSAIVVPIVVKITEKIRIYTIPNTFVSKGLMDTLSTKFFWSYGIFIVSILMTLFVIFLFIPNKINDNDKQSVESLVVPAEINVKEDEVGPPAYAPPEVLEADKKVTEKTNKQLEENTENVSSNNSVDLKDDPDAKCRDADGNWICE